MSQIQPNPASDLATIAATEARTREIIGYQRGGPYLILWGLIWMLGYGLGELLPQQRGLIWGVLMIPACLGMVVLRRRPAGRSDWRRGVAALMIGAFAMAVVLLFQPHDAAKLALFSALLVATIYGVTGLFRGWRWTATGAGIGALTWVGYLWLPVHFGLWMAVVSGGGLILAGLWMRRL